MADPETLPAARLTRLLTGTDPNDETLPEPSLTAIGKPTTQRDLTSCRCRRSRTRASRRPVRGRSRATSGRRCAAWAAAAPGRGYGGWWWWTRRCRASAVRRRCAGNPSGGSPTGDVRSAPGSLLRRVGGRGSGVGGASVGARGRGANPGWSPARRSTQTGGVARRAVRARRSARGRVGPVQPRRRSSRGAGTRSGSTGSRRVA